MILILHNIRSIHNVGSLFRTADAMGVEKIYLFGYTPDPVDRFGRLRADLAKVALGAESTIPWEHVDDWSLLVGQLRDAGYSIVAVEQSENSVDYDQIDVTRPLALVLGNEVGGVPTDVLETVDEIAEIPMHGQKESLNVSVAGGIVLADIRRRHS